MKIEIVKVTDWKRAFQSAMWTINKKGGADCEPSDKWKKSMCKAEHSPLRLVEFDIKIEDIPNHSATCLTRHHIGVEKFVGTHRSDRTDFEDIKVNRMTPTSIWITANAQALINISKVRLCSCADSDTRKVWKAVKDAMYEVDPIVASNMVKSCVYRGFCPEFKGCNYCNTSEYEIDRRNYITK